MYRLIFSENLSSGPGRCKISSAMLLRTGTGAMIGILGVNAASCPNVWTFPGPQALRLESVRTQIPHSEFNSESALHQNDDGDQFHRLVMMC